MKNLITKNFEKILILPTLLLFSSLTYAFVPPSIVYRCDSRSMEEINAAGGFYPHDSRGVRDYDLMNLFSGEQPDGYVTGFVSVSYTLKIVIKHCIALSSVFEKMYLYVIIPSSNF